MKTNLYSLFNYLQVLKSCCLEIFFIIKMFPHRIEVYEVDALSNVDVFSNDTYGCWFSLDHFRNKASANIFRAASCLTDPACKTHEYFRRLYVIEDHNHNSSKIANFARKFFLTLGLIGFAAMAIFTSLPGIALRSLASKIQTHPYLYTAGNAPEKTLPLDCTFSLLSWNVCCTAGGYSISDGGVQPWSFRIDDIIEKIIEKDADVNCLYETFDTSSAFYIAQKLKERGYAHVYFNIGPKAVGVSSGILVASKYKILNPEFTPYPLETLVGRTKNAAKGVFAFDLESQGTPFARIFTTHLQHSEEPAFPTHEEVAGRRQQMQIILDKIDTIRDRCIVVTGDLNLDDEEYRASSWHNRFRKGDLFQERTWGGDKYCAQMVGKRVSCDLSLDHTMVLNGTAHDIHTTLVETGFDAAVYKPEALSDHAGLFSRITVQG